MTSKTNAAACVDASSDTARFDKAHADALQAIAGQGDPPLDIHDICRLRRACGFTDDLALTECEAQAINTRLYGMSAISALLVGADDEGAFKLSRWLQGGLHSALYALTEDAQAVLHRANEKAAEAQKASAA
ncbi:hypothetical protein HS961_16925 [Comamonas piscis]|uniref:Uncharacterized protein n=1 Tax=Comamonas piscis TaxID=1562974 RepID=A0A7G5EK57_9BURK|nr:hypothetical protein [Comamonas piscis]QMV74382.1 hypothetical protein HS961_16925 [Comamonas piscis]WSO32831.1 hypothetical protein VUJ63_16975 [Comamonas piscis]